MENYGDTLVNKEMRENTAGRWWTVALITRWSLMSGVLVGLTDYPGLQISSLLLVSGGFMLAIINGQPYETWAGNMLALFNEAMVSIYLCLLAGLSNH